MFVDVKCDDDTIQIAEFISDTEVIFMTKVGNGLYNFEDDITIIPTESICGRYDCKTLEETDLFMKASGGYALLDDSDEEYVCSDEDEESDSESLIDEDEDEA